MRKSEKGIAIFAPCKYRTKTENDDASGSSPSAAQVAAPSGDRPKTEVRGFRVVHVFDIAQTDGEPIEDLSAIAPKLLSGDAPPLVWDALVAVANDDCFEVIRHQKRNENGYCDFRSRR